MRHFFLNLECEFLLVWPYALREHCHSPTFLSHIYCCVLMFESPRSDQIAYTMLHTYAQSIIGSATTLDETTSASKVAVIPLITILLLALLIIILLVIALMCWKRKRRHCTTSAHSSQEQTIAEMENAENRDPDGIKASNEENNDVVQLPNLDSAAFAGTKLTSNLGTTPDIISKDMPITPPDKDSTSTATPPDDKPAANNVECDSRPVLLSPSPSLTVSTRGMTPEDTATRGMALNHEDTATGGMAPEDTATGTPDTKLDTTLLVASPSSVSISSCEEDSEVGAPSLLKAQGPGDSDRLQYVEIDFLTKVKDTHVPQGRGSVVYGEDLEVEYAVVKVARVHTADETDEHPKYYDL